MELGALIGSGLFSLIIFILAILIIISPLIIMSQLSTIIKELRKRP